MELLGNSGGYGKASSRYSIIAEDWVNTVLESIKTGTKP
jgi:hypothetical protein